MGAWIADNWWWLIPLALAAPWAIFVFRRTKAIAAGPQPIRTMADRTARYLLSVLATLAGVFAISTDAYAAIVVALFMFVVLHIPPPASRAIPNWWRYAAFAALYFVFVLVSGAGRVPSQAAQSYRFDPGLARIVGFFIYIGLAAAFAALWHRIWRVGTLPSIIAAACTAAVVWTMVYVASDDIQFDPTVFAALFFLAWMVTSLVQLRASRR